MSKPNKFENEKEWAIAVQQAGGVLWSVGGAERDRLMGREPKDRDYCVTGFNRETFTQAFPMAEQVIGKNGEHTVDVFLVPVGGEWVEVALAREEIKTGTGYHGFRFVSEKDTTIEKDLERRDLTINAIARNVLSGAYADPFGGRNDIENRVLRATSDAFYEDALRVYRVAVRYAKEDGFVVEERTKKMMKKASQELPMIHKQRVVEELRKAFSAKRPDKFFRLLQEMDVLHVHYRPIADLAGVEQPIQHHPEGDVFEHTMQTLVAMRQMTDEPSKLYAALVHDVGKTITPKESWPAHHGHEKMGVPIVDELSNNLGVPKEWKKAALFGTENHGRFHSIGEMRAVKIVDLLTDANRTPLKVKGLAELCLADKRGRNDALATHPYVDFALKAWEFISVVKGNVALEGKKAGEDKRKRQASIVRELQKKHKNRKARKGK